MAKRSTYTDDFKQVAVQRVLAAGYPTQPGAIATTAALLDMPPSTLRGWLKAEGYTPSAELPPPATPAVVDLLDAELRDVLAAMDGVRATASYRELGSVLKVLIDKRQVLNGEPTERAVIEFDDTRLTDAQRIDRIAALLDAARTRRDRSASGAVGDESAQQPDGV